MPFIQLDKTETSRIPAVQNIRVSESAKVIDLQEHQIGISIEDTIRVLKNDGFDFQSKILRRPAIECLWFDNVFDEISWVANSLDFIRAKFALVQASHASSKLPPRIYEGPKGGVVVEYAKGNRVFTAVFEDNATIMYSSNSASSTYSTFEFNEVQNPLFEMLYRFSNEVKLMDF